MKKVSVTSTSSTGRNLRFHDNYSGSDMTRAQFVKQIKAGNYDGYYVRDINGLATPVSKPDGSTRNNLG